MRVSCPQKLADCRIDRRRRHGRLHDTTYSHPPAGCAAPVVGDSPYQSKSIPASSFYPWLPLNPFLSKRPAHSEDRGLFAILLKFFLYCLDQVLPLFIDSVLRIKQFTPLASTCP